MKDVSKIAKCSAALFLLSFLLLSLSFLGNKTYAQTKDNNTKNTNKTEQAEPIKPESHKVIESDNSSNKKEAPKSGLIIPEDISKLKSSPEPDIIAKVGDTNIKKQSLVNQITLMLAEYKDYPDNLKVQIAKGLRNEALEFLILNELLLIEANKRNITVSEDEIKKEMDVFINNIQGGRKTLEETFKQYNITEDEFKARLKREMLIKKMMSIICQLDVSPTDDEVNKFYEKNIQMFFVPDQIRISQILVKNSQTDSKDGADKAKKKIEEAYQKIKKGADFANIAKEYSECPSAPKGGDLGYNIKEKDYIPNSKIPFLPKSMENIAFGLKKGDVSNVFEDESGFHIIKVTDKIDARQSPISEVKNDIIDTIKEERRVKLFTDWSQEAIKITKPEIYKEAFSDN